MTLRRWATNSVKSSYDGPGTEELIKTASLMSQRFSSLKETIDKMKKTLEEMTEKNRQAIAATNKILEEQSSQYI